MSKKDLQVAGNGNGNALAVVEPRAFGLTVDEQVAGVDVFGRDDLQIPRLTLVQAQHQEIPDHLKHVGEWYNNLTGEFHATVSAVLLSVAKGRTAFPREFSRDSEPLCVSDDAVTPRAEYIGRTVFDSDNEIQHEIDGSPCVECPFEKFSANGETPLCAKNFSYAMLDAESGLPFVIRAQRTAIGAARQLNTIARTLGRRKLIVIASREVKSDTGTYFEPVFATGAATPADLVAFANQMGQSLGNFVARSDGRGTNGSSAVAQNGHGNGVTRVVEIQREEDLETVPF